MGNSQTLSLVGVDDQVQLKEGAIEEVFPFPHNCTTYEELLRSKALKDYVTQHWDDFSPFPLLMADGTNNERLFSAMDCFGGSSPDEEKRMHEEMKKLESIDAAGIKLKLAETIRILGEDIAGATSLRPFPLLVAMQQRLTVLSKMNRAFCEELCEKERKEKHRSLTDNPLTSLSHTNVPILLSTFQLSMNMIRVVSKLFRQDPASKESAEFSKALIDACNSFKVIPNHALFNSWFPRMRFPKRKLSVSDYTFLVKETNGAIGPRNMPGLVAFRAENPTFIVEFKEPQSLPSLRLSWIDPKGPGEYLIGAPERYSVFYRCSGDSCFHRLGCFVSDELKSSTGSWHFTHHIEKENVVELKITMSKKQSKHNLSDFSCLYAIEFSQVDPGIAAVDTISLLHELQCNLCSLFEFPQTRPHAFCAVVNLLSSAGSLNLLLSFVFEVLRDASCSSLAVGFLEENSIKGFLEEIGSTCNGFRSSFDDAHSERIEVLNLDDSSVIKSPTCAKEENQFTFSVEKEQEGFLVLSPSLKNTCSKFEWKLSVSDPSVVSIGLMEKCEGVEKIDPSKSWLWNLRTGALKSKGIQLDVLASIISSNDSIHLQFDGEKNMLLCSINDGPWEVLFENVPNETMFVLRCGSEAQECQTCANFFFQRAVFSPSVKLSALVQQPLPSSHQITSYTQAAFVLLEATASLGNLIEQRSSARANFPSEIKSVYDFQDAFPHVVDTSFHTFLQFVNLLDLIAANPDSDHFLRPLLSVLHVQLLDLCVLDYPLVELVQRHEQQYGRPPTEELMGVFHRLETHLLHLLSRSTSPSEIKSTAKSCLCAGVLVFYSTPAQRIETFFNVLTGNSDFGIDNDVLSAFLKVFCRIEEINLLVQTISTQPCDVEGVFSALSKLVELISECDISHYKDELSSALFDQRSAEMAKKFVVHFSEALFGALLSDKALPPTAQTCFSKFVVSVIDRVMESIAAVRSSSEWSANKFFQHSLVCRLLLPMIQGLSLNGIPTLIVSAVINKIKDLTGLLLQEAEESSICSEAMCLLKTVGSHSSSMALGSNGKNWKALKAHLLDGDSTFEITEGGMLYTSSSSSNTCAIASVHFTKGQKAAWVFVLESDSSNDECSVFGAARMPLSSRCYSSSPDLWMRRSYNGYLYALGQTTHDSMGKIHPGDNVRVEYDGVAGTLSYSVNDGEMQVGFTDVWDDVYPACGSYRSGVSIRLIKVEVFDKTENLETADDFRELYPTADIFWTTKNSLSHFKAANLLHHIGATDKTPRKASYNKCITARATRGALYGVHEWVFEITAGSMERFSFGLLVGPTIPDESKRLSALVPSKEESSVAVPIGSGRFSFVWNSDGSLWCDGEKVGTRFGMQAFPLKKRDRVRFILNRTNGTLEVFVNNLSLGLAFGPCDSDAHCKIAIPQCREKEMIDPSRMIFPAASLLGSDAVLKISSGGFAGSSVLPVLLLISHFAMSALARMTCRLLNTRVSSEESQVEELFESSMFLGGLDREFVALNASDDHFEDLMAALKNVDTLLIDDVPRSQLSITLNELARADMLAPDVHPQFKEIYAWLDSIDPDSSNMRKMLEKTSSYNFPRCELPVLACMIKHAEIGEELNAFLESPSMDRVPSENLTLIWQKIKQLRNFLRKQRQVLKNSTVSPSTDVEKLSQASRSLGFHSSPLEWWSLKTVDQTDSVAVSAIGRDSSRKELFLWISNCDNKSIQNVNVALQGENILSSELAPVGDHGVLVWFDTSLVIDKIKEILTMDVTISLSRQSTNGEEVVRSRVDVGHPIDMKNLSPHDRFEALCDRVRAKAIFLLLLSPTCRLLNDNASKLNLIDLTSIYSNVSGRVAKVDLSRRKTQERWKRVMEFLHIQSKLNRQHSHSNIEEGEQRTQPFSTIAAENDSTEMSGAEMSNSQAAIQACASFVNASDVEFDITALFHVMLQRIKRAKNRMMGFQTIDAALRDSRIVSNPSALLDFLSIVKCEIPPRTIEQARATNKTSHIRTHFMDGLQGCPLDILKSLQQAVDKGHQSLAAVLGEMIEKWEHCDGAYANSFSEISRVGKLELKNNSFMRNDYTQVLLMLMRWWTMNFSVHDAKGIFDSGVVSFLHKLSSFRLRESVMYDYHRMGDRIVRFIQAVRPHHDKQAFAAISLWSKDEVESGLLNGSLTPRQILLHLVLFTAAAFPPKTALGKSGLCAEELASLYLSGEIDAHKVSALYAHIAVIVGEQDGKKTNEKTSDKLTEEAASLGAFDPENKASSIQLSEEFFVSSLRQNASSQSLCVYGSKCYSAETIEENGNYFEITILSLGRGEIGVGLANRNKFSSNGNMPGWKPHSYGYHGDDGKKYGEGATEGTWQCFETGDVIGCGVDFARRAIFFTRNGELLGDAFTNITVESLWPIVGFSNRNTEFNKVRINFGLTAFMYESPAIKIARAVLEKRNADAHKIATSNDVEVLLSDTALSVTLESLLTSASSSSEMSLTLAQAQLWYKQLLRDVYNVEEKCRSYHNLSRAAWSLMKLVSFQITRSVDVDLGSSSEGESRTRRVSAFDRPKEATAGDAARLLASICSSIGHELYIGCKFLLQFTSDHGDVNIVSIHELEELALKSNSEENFSITPLDSTAVLLFQQTQVTLLNLLMLSSSAFREEVIGSKFLTALFLILDIGSPASKLNSLMILRKLLPEMDPDAAEGFSPSSWKKEMTPSKGSGAIIVSKLLALCTKAFLQEEEHIFGFGDVIFSVCESVALLLQHLFRSPKWAEIVARSMTTALRVVNTAWDDSNEPTKNAIISYACAAAHCVSLQPVMAAGSRVTLDGSMEAVVVAIHADRNEVDIAMRSALSSGLPGLGCIETVDRSKLQCRTSFINVENVSQPVVPQLLEIAKLIIKWMVSLDEKDLAKEKIKLSLAAVVFNAIRQLLVRFPDVVVEPLLDLNVFSEFMKCSLRLLPLKRMYTPLELEHLWKFSQARYLEARNAVSVSSAITTEDLPVSAAKEAEVDSAQSQTMTEISATSRTSRAETIAQFSSTHGVNGAVATQLLEYAMFDEELAASLIYRVDQAPTETSESKEREPGRSVRFAETSEAISIVSLVKVTHEDANIMRGIEHASATSEADPLPSGNLLKHVESLSLTDARPNDLIVSSTIDGESAIDAHPVAIFEQSLNSSSFLARVYDRSTGLCISRCMLETQSKSIDSFGAWSADEIFSISPLIDLSVAVVSMRGVLLQLFSSGCVDWVRFLENDPSLSRSEKLLVLSSNQPVREALGAMFATLTADTADEERQKLQKLLAKSMVENSHNAFNNISFTRISKASGSSEKASEQLVLSSPHPFKAPHHCHGKITGGEDWKGMSIQCDPRCHFPSTHVSLKLYKSRVAFDKDEPHHVFAADKPRPFDSVAFNDVKELYYRFDAPSCSDRPHVDIISVCGHYEYSKEQVLKAVSNSAAGKVGLGEEDTLFNLFDESYDISDASTSTVCADRSLNKGKWAFQATVLDVPSSDDQNDNLCFIGLRCAVKGDVSDDYVAGGNETSVAISSNGDVLHMGQVLKQAFLTPFAVNDVITVIVSVEDDTVSLQAAKNDSSLSEAIAVSLSSLQASPEKNLNVVFSLPLEWRLSLNFGERDWAAIDPSLLVDTRPLCCSMDSEELAKQAWGYALTVSPVEELDLDLTREFDLVWKSKQDESGSLDAHQKPVWIWRGRPRNGFFPVADVLTHTPHPPSRQVVVHEQLCKRPKSFQCVFYSQKQNVVVWRPVPEEGFVALGDIVTSGSSASSPPSTSSILCVPLWAVTPCKVNDRVVTIKKVGEGKNVHNATLWRSKCEHGFFFGSPFEKRTDTLSLHTDFKCSGVGVGYTFSASFQSELTAEWTDERDVLSKPSLSWSLAAMQCFLENRKLRSIVMNEFVFRELIQYMRCSHSVSPLRVLPLLIAMIRRTANEQETHSLPLQETKSLCKHILSEAVNMVQAQRRTELPRAVVDLVNFVVELQAVNVVSSIRRDRQAISRNMERSKGWQESKEEDVFEESKEECVSSSVLASAVGEGSLSSVEEQQHQRQEQRKLQQQWWWRREKLNAQDLKLHRVIKRENLDSMFCKESVLLKLKQVLKFLYAINEVPSTATDTSRGDTFLERSFPKLMTSKLWLEHVSTTSFIESRHPYTERRFSRTVFFPGAQQLRVSFDRRCALSKGDRLVLRGGEKEVFLQGESDWTQGLLFSSQELSVEFVAADADRGNESNEWGWAMLVSASGPVFETAEVVVDLRNALCQSLLSQESPAGYESCAATATEIETAPETALITAPKVESAPDAEASAAETVTTTTDVVSSSEKESSPDTDKPVVVRSDSEESDADAESVPTRPASKRGKREKKAAVGEKATAAGAEEEKSGDAETETTIDEEALVIMQNGILIKSGEVSIPHASELDLCVDRCEKKKRDIEKGENSEEDVSKYTLAVRLQSSSSAEKEKRVISFKILPGQSAQHSLPGAHCEFFIYAIQSSKLELLMRKDTQEKEEEEAEKAETASSNSESVTDIDELIAAFDAVDAVDIQEKASSPPTEWSCPMCTFINSMEDESCSMCSTTRPSEEGGTAVCENGLWFCTRCTLVNQLRALNCSACGNPRGDAETPTPVERDSEEEGETREAPVEREAVVSAAELFRDAKEKDKDSVVHAIDKDVVRIVAKGKLCSLSRFETRLEAAILSRGQTLTPLQLHHRVSCWTQQCDEALLSYLNGKSYAKDDASSTTFALPKQFLAFEGQVLSRLSMQDVLVRTQLIEAFNRQLESLLPLVDLSTDDPRSLGAMIRRANKYLLNKIKQPLLERAISSTAANGSEADLPATIVLDNLKALNSREVGEVDIATSRNCFVQAFKQLQHKDAAVFRHCFSTDRVFQITFSEESGIDAGGVFREGISRIVEDLFSEHFNLLLLSPNGQQAVHTAMDKYLPNPKHCGPLAMEMFAFVGRLMAMSIRVKLCLPFEFPSLVWKKIAGEEVGKYDLSEIDVITARQLEDIENCHTDPVEPVCSNEAFVEKFRLKFTYIGADGVERELCKHGAAKQVTFDNRQEYVDLSRQMRLGEFDAQIAAMAKGMGEVIPMRALCLFSSAQLEELVCGNPKIDIELWKSQTDVSVPTRTAELFWKVMESLSPAEQAGFIRFAWGRSRLPSRKEDFTTRMKLQNGGRAALPVSHTCFFSIELPTYSTEEEMRHGLLTAIHFGVGGILNG